MPTAKIIQMFSEGEIREKLLLQLALQCAPLLKGIKAANIILLSEENTRELFHILKGSGISVKVLCRRCEKLVLYLYRKEQLRTHLKSKDILEALRLFGYGSSDMEELLKELSVHTQDAYEHTGTCPHEIGLFLGYPIEDVLGFVEHKGANYLLSGYWKVYENAETAASVFRQFDQAKKAAVEEVFRGCTLREIICA